MYQLAAALGARIKKCADDACRFNNVTFKGCACRLDVSPRQGIDQFAAMVLTGEKSKLGKGEVD
jgi:hypothetical protein